MKSFFMLGLLMAIASSCTTSRQTYIGQGIQGTVVWLSGNQMPSSEIPRNSEGKPVQRTVLIYELTNRRQAIRQELLFSSLSTKLIREVQTDTAGFFRAELPVGEYSVFTRETNGYFANRFDGHGNINPVTVAKGAMTSVRITIDYKAYY